MRILNKKQLCSHGNKEGREVVCDLLDAGLDALDPYTRVKQLLHIEGDTIHLSTSGFEMKGDPHQGDITLSLCDYDRIFVLGAAKGVQRAALAFEEVLGEHLTRGIVIAKHGEEIICNRIEVVLAGHPVPDDDCVIGCQSIEEMISDLSARDLVFTIFGSGCGSLFTYPAGDITMEELSRFTHMMQIEKGVPTSDLNPIRTHIDRFKGGRILRLLQPATVINTVTADPSKMDQPVTRMTYDQLMRVNTFFPTIATGTTYADCIEILHKWDAWDDTPASIRAHLLAGTKETDNMTPAEYETYGARFLGLIFKDATVYPAVRRRAEALGIPCRMISEYQCAEAREAGKVDAAMALTAQRLGEPFEAPVILMSSGENVVTVGEERGIGGRNQEYCLGAAQIIAGSERITVGAVDTDATDGPGGLSLDGAPECLAGAIVDGDTVREAKAKNIDLWQALKTHATSAPLWQLGCGVDAEKNVSALDLRIIYIME